MSENPLTEILHTLKNLEKGQNQIKQRLEKIEEATAKHDDVMAMRETLEGITETTATYLEDKREAGDVLLKSHFDHAYKDIKEMKEHMENGFSFMQEGFKQTTENFQQIFRLMESWVYKQKGMDEIQRFHHERITNQEKQTELLQQEINYVKKKISGDDTTTD